MFQQRTAVLDTRYLVGMGGLLLLLSLIVTPPVSATDMDEMDHGAHELRTLMDNMQKEMTTIEGERDPKARESMLDEHMQSMRDAMSMMQKEMPATKRMHVHKKSMATTRGNSSSSDEPDAHDVQMMDVMEQMEVLMEQMSKHRKAMREG